MIGFRLKLFAISLFVILAVVATSGVFLERALRAELESRLAEDLTRRARMAAQIVEGEPGMVDAEASSVAAELGAASGARVTLVRADGVVLGDSKLSASEAARLESHFSRPEIRGALASGVGRSQRYSTTLGTNMLYVAVPCRIRASQGVLRVAMSLDEVDRAAGELRMLLLLAGLVGAGVAVLLSFAASHLIAAMLGRMVQSARALVKGDAPAAAGSHAVDGLAGLVGSVQHMAGELERAVADLAESRDRLGAVLEGIGDGVLALDPRGVITHANHAAMEMLGLAGSPVGRPLSEVTVASSLHKLVAVARNNRPENIEFNLPGDPPRRVSVHATPQRGTGGAVVVMHDVTRLRRLETVRQDFVANASHELRTPVSVIRANTETLLDGALDDPERARDFVAAAHRNAERLGRLIADLLDISRIESGQYAVTPKSVGLAVVVEQVIDSLDNVARAKEITVDTEISEGLSVWANDKALDQIVVNLVDNAIKYTPPGGRVCIRGRRDGQHVRLEVHDNGPGIPALHRSRIFERFYRVDTGRSREMGGTGLGLSIVKHLVEAMGGEIGLYPAEPHGAVFWVTVPAEDADA